MIEEVRQSDAAVTVRHSPIATRDDVYRDYRDLKPLRTREDVSKFLKGILQPFVDVVDIQESNLLDALYARNAIIDVDIESVTCSLRPTRRERARHLWKILNTIDHEAFVSKVLPVLCEKYGYIIPTEFWDTSSCLNGSKVTENNLGTEAGQSCLRCMIEGRVRLPTLADCLYSCDVISFQLHSDTKNHRLSETNWSEMFESLRNAPDHTALKVDASLRKLLSDHNLPVPDSVLDVMAQGFPCTCSKKEPYGGPDILRKWRVMCWLKESEVAMATGCDDFQHETARKLLDDEDRVSAITYLGSDETESNVNGELNSLSDSLFATAHLNQWQRRQRQLCDTDPFSDIRLLESRPAHIAVFLHYLISKQQPNSMLFNIVSNVYEQTPGCVQDLRRWSYEIFSTFLAPESPLKVPVPDVIVNRILDTLVTFASPSKQEASLRNIFESSRNALQGALSNQLSDFRQTLESGRGGNFGVHYLHKNMDAATELKIVGKYLIPHLSDWNKQKKRGQLCDHDQAAEWALVTFLQKFGMTKELNNLHGELHSFLMKDKRNVSSLRTLFSKEQKSVNGHKFVLQSFDVPRYCSMCNGLLWGVGYQGYACLNCLLGVHQRCFHEFSTRHNTDTQEAETTTGTGVRRSQGSCLYQLGGSILTLTLNEKPNQSACNPQTPSTTSSSSVSSPHRSSASSSPAYIPSPSTTHISASESTGYVKPDSTIQLWKLKVHTMRAMLEKAQHDFKTLQLQYIEYPSEALYTQLLESRTTMKRLENHLQQIMDSAADLRKSMSSASDCSVFSYDIFHTTSENTYSWSDFETVESKRVSSDVLVTSTFNSELEENPLQETCSMENKRQDTINELIKTEQTHVCNLAVLDRLFHKPMLNAEDPIPDLGRAMFPNIDELLVLHMSLCRELTDRRHNNMASDIGDVLLNTFDGSHGDLFRKACSEFCRNQSFVLKCLRYHRLQNAKLSQFLKNAETNPLCRKLELKDLILCQVQRLINYPKLIKCLMEYTQSGTEEYTRLSRALECSRNNLAYVNQTTADCENHRKLSEMQKRLDIETRSFETFSGANVMELKKLDLTEHTLVHEGVLTWRLRPNQTVNVHAILLEDMLVLLQRVDDRLVLKYHTTIKVTGGTKCKCTCSPILKARNLLARSVATETKAFFVIDSTDYIASIHELVAQNEEDMNIWCRLINERSDKSASVNKKSKQENCKEDSLQGRTLEQYSCAYKLSMSDSENPPDSKTMVELKKETPPLIANCQQHENHVEEKVFPGTFRKIDTNIPLETSNRYGTSTPRNPDAKENPVVPSRRELQLISCTQSTLPNSQNTVATLQTQPIDKTSFALPSPVTLKKDVFNEHMEKNPLQSNTNGVRSEFSVTDPASSLTEFSWTTTDENTNVKVDLMRSTNSMSATTTLNKRGCDEIAANKQLIPAEVMRLSEPVKENQPVDSSKNDLHRQSDCHISTDGGRRDLDWINDEKVNECLQPKECNDRVKHTDRSSQQHMRVDIYSWL